MTRRELDRPALPSLLAFAGLVSSDPLLGLMESYKADTNAEKVDLGVGVFKNERGKSPILSSVRRAEVRLLAREHTKTYTAPYGDARFLALLLHLVFGGVVDDTCITGIQTPGASGGLRVAADFIARFRPESTLWLPEPTWVNHGAVVGQSGLTLRTYPYYDRDTNVLDFDRLALTLSKIPKNDTVLLHGCCHNPSGADPDKEQWNTIAEIAERRGFLLLVDLAYQGFGQGLDVDAYGIRLLAERLPCLLATVSCSKNFGIYNDRTGAVYLKAEQAPQAAIAQSHMQDIVRGHYFVPPAHGSKVVRTILSDPKLYAEWKRELDYARQRICRIRLDMVNRARLTELGDSLDYLLEQQGMFSFLALEKEQIQTLRRRHSIYMAESGRINLSGLNAKNMDYVLKALVCVNVPSTSRRGSVT